MKTLTFKSTKGGKFNINLPNNYKKIKLPFFNKWVSALEGGSFRQCTGTLCESGNKRLTYCCLGVLSKIQGRLIKSEGEFTDGLGGSSGDLTLNNELYSILSSRGTFPKGVHVSIQEEDGAYRFADDLVECNDDFKFSFKDIAKIIKTLYKA